MRLKHLESALSSLQREFPNPDVTLEQYPSSPALAAAVVWTALEAGHVGPGRTVLDLGAGTGLLTCAALAVESDHVWAVDCDNEALRVAMENVGRLHQEDDEEEEEGALMDAPVSFVLAKVKSVGSDNTNNQHGNKNHHNKNKGKRQKGRGGGKHNPRATTATGPSSSSSTQQARDQILTDDDGLPLRNDMVDTVLTNPPFGTKHNAGMDLRFLRTATRLARHAVYSFHKTSTRAFLQKHVETVWNMPFAVVAEMKFDLPQTMKFHKQATVDVNVDLIRIDVSGGGSTG